MSRIPPASRQAPPPRAAPRTWARARRSWKRPSGCSPRRVSTAPAWTRSRPRPGSPSSPSTAISATRRPCSPRRQGAIASSSCRPPCSSRTPDVPLRERLLQIARAFFAMISSPEARRRAPHPVHAADGRLAGAADVLGSRPAARAGRVRRVAAPARVDAGELEIDDIPRAAAQFFALLKGEPHAQLVFGCGAMRAARYRSRTWRRRWTCSCAPTRARWPLPCATAALCRTAC